MGGPVWGSSDPTITTTAALEANKPGTCTGVWYDELDNFYRCNVEYGGDVWPSSEAAFQAAKFDPVGGADAREAIKHSSGGSDCFLSGQTRDATLRADWDTVKVEVMYEVSKKNPTGMHKGTMQQRA